MKKLLLILLCLPLLFSCQQCKECEPPEDNQIIGYTQVLVGYQPGQWLGFDEQGNSIWGPDTPIYEDQPIYSPIPFQEVCRDNFSSKSDYNDYIKNLEEGLGYSCKSDFWN